MPVAILLRVLARIALLGLAGAIGRRGVPPAWRTPGQPVPDAAGGAGPRPATAGAVGALSRAIAGRLGSTVDLARVLVHLLAVLVFLVAAGTLVTAGTTLTTLGPRWVGILLLVLAALAALVLVGELRTTLRLRTAWRQRRRDERVRAAPTQLPPPA